MAILTSVYKGLNKISRSSHPGRGGGYFPANFFYAWLVKNFNAYELASKASSSLGMAKFSGIGQTKSFQLEEDRELIGSGRGFRWHSSIINSLKETLMDDGKLSRADFAYLDSLVIEHYCPNRFNRQSGFYQDVLVDLDFDNLLDSEIILCYQQTLMCYRTGSQVLLPGRCNLLERNTTPAFCDWWSKMFVSSTCITHTRDSKRKRSDLFDTNISKDEGKLGSKPKLKIVHSGKPLEPFFHRWRIIPRIDVVILATPIPAIPIQSIAPLPQDEPLIEVCEPSTIKITKLPPEGAKNIMDILDTEPNPTDCMGENDDVNFKEKLAHIPLPSGSQCFPSIGRIPSFGEDLFDSQLRLVDLRGVCSPDDDEVESIRRVNALSVVLHPQRPLRAPQGEISIFNADAVIKEADAVIKEVDKNAARVFGKAILDKVSRTPFDGLPSLKGDFDSLYATILQKNIDVTPLESKVEGLIKQACDFKDLQQSYSGRTSAKNMIFVTWRCKLDEASGQLNIEGTHYEAKTTELKQVELRHEELLRELQLLEDQKKDLGSQVAANEHLLQEVEREVIDLQGHIDILNATEVMDVATKASLEKAEAYIKESFEDLKNFQ
ncbi:LOW QUALITY PROTEIN: hypothetical protein Cgig2_003160 [Carnegiea gigantea]|uniref:Uncharacterized protein n=1 Tax=Carnegiea gigantea TaxID=171969 RepID=A0A9Q1K3G8_9CARY|nr:LOW QUALITY PROTEIN: hypothetical protein Cgig2_003160 [Carnegiea gigantea]